MATLTRPTTPLTPAEYLAAERGAENRSEYVDGVGCTLNLGTVYDKVD